MTKRILSRSKSNALSTRLTNLIAMMLPLVLLLTKGTLADDFFDDAPYPIPKNLMPPIVASKRSDRFPSVEERIKIYMSDWYAPPCPENSNALVRYRYNYSSDSEFPTLLVQEPRDRVNSSVYVMSSTIEADTAFFLDRSTLLECIRPEGKGDPRLARRIVGPRSNMFLYCSDAVQSVLTAYDHIMWERTLFETATDNKGFKHQNQPKDTFPPLLLQFGDLRHSHIYRFMDLPHIKKFRSATTRDELERVTSPQCIEGARSAVQTPHTYLEQGQLQPLVWKLATSRHFRLLYKVHRYDTPWHEKINMAVFRGQLTGAIDGYAKGLNDEQNCLNLRRCRLVYKHGNSSLVHAKLTSTRNRIPNVLNGVNLLGEAVTIRRLLQYKAIIMLEGNDVASGLKWALLSQSVVLMPEPKHTSWALEELLQPWVHYIPLNENATDVEEKMQWIVDHNDMAQRISERGTFWMEDLVFHPDALEDDRLIQEEMLRRYATHFAYDESVSPVEPLLNSK